MTRRRKISSAKKFNLSVITRLLRGGHARPLKSMLAKMEPSDIATLISQLSNQEAVLLTKELFTLPQAAEALSELPQGKIRDLFSEIEFKKLIHFLNSCSASQVSYLISNLPPSAQNEFASSLSAHLKNSVIQQLSYEESFVGRQMDLNVFYLDKDLSAEQALSQLRKLKQKEKLQVYYIYCTSEGEKSSSKGPSTNNGKLIGAVSLRQLAIAEPEEKLEDICVKDIVYVHPEHTTREAAKLISKYDFFALPVVDEQMNLIGLITIDTIIDILQDLGEEKIYAKAGLKKDDRAFTSAFSSIGKRLPWMLLNLVLAFLASSVVSLFESTMSELIILASLKNIVAGVSGNAAIQSLTVITRGLAAGDFSFITKKRALIKELTVGLFLGCFTGLTAAICIYIWKGSLLVSTVIFASMTMTSLAAALIGSTVPILMEMWGRDPAIASGALTTTITDILSFLSFLGLAQLLLNYMG